MLYEGKSKTNVKYLRTRNLLFSSTNWFFTAGSLSSHKSVVPSFPSLPSSASDYTTSDDGHYQRPLLWLPWHPPNSGWCRCGQCGCMLLKYGTLHDDSRHMFANCSPLLYTRNEVRRYTEITPSVCLSVCLRARLGKWFHALNLWSLNC